MAVIRGRRIRWQAVVGLLGFVGLVIATATMARDTSEQALPSLPILGAALVCQFVTLFFVAQAWVTLFPPHVDRAALAAGLYTSQLTKYLPAGGFVQAASQVALSSQDGVATAALRLPVFSLCAVVASFTVGSGLAFDTDLPGWARLLALCGLGTLVALDRRVLAALLRLARRLVKRLPEPDALPPQRAVLRCYGALLVNQLTYAAAFVLLLGDLTDITPWVAGAAFAAAWGLGYLALPVPSGLGVREAVLVAALPGLPTASLLAASVAHRLLSLVAEATLAGLANLRAARLGRASRDYDRSLVRTTRGDEGDVT